MNKYEISLWEDFPDTTQNGIPYLNEKKLCVIGSDSMTSMVRAVEPKLINNVNGTNTFTFKMYYTYIDEITGESYPNPFISMLINERKVKVFWKDEWYDLLIKNIEENTNDKSVTYTCKDSYITELSRNGYNLEFTSELQNNNGTAEELVQEVLKGSGWKFDEDHSVKIYQSSEEPVYETSFSGNINAIINEPNKTGSTIIPRNAIVLLFKSEIDRITTYNGGSLNTDISVIYSEDSTFMTEPNEMVVLNGMQYKFSATASYNRITGKVTITATGGAQAQIEVANVSKRYRGKRYINSIRSVYDKTFGRYVNVYTDTRGAEIRGFSKTEFSDPLSVVNLFANSSDFSNTSGWEGNNLSWEMYPPFTNNTNISNYNSKGYLHLSSGEYTNSGLSANSQYLTPSEGDIKRGDTGGFHVNDKYVFRIKAHAGSASGGLLSSFGFNVKNEVNQSYFTVASQGIKDGWLEYSCTCITACPSNEIQNLKLVLTPSTSCYVESVQFFKEAMGEDNDGNLQRMEPGQVGIQGTSKTVYKYYYPLSEGSQLQPEEVPFEYIGTEESSLFTPVTSYEKIATIEEKESNRFNILQAIAESFECWVRFSILHDEQGKVLIDNNGKPEKYVTLVEYVGKDLGWSFDYGIDLKAIKRKIISDEITTKVIVVPNQNEFAKNGFCTIARSKLNYSKEIFILNLDYYVNQGMLDRAQLDLDLYDPLGNGIGYFYHLNQLNTKYDENAEILSQKRSELLKQESELTVLQSYLNASKQEQTSCESDMMFLAGGVPTIEAANSYAAAHTNNSKVQSLANTIGQLGTTIPQLESKVDSLENAINNLKQTIQDLEVEQNNLSTDISDIHDEFFQKYSKYIQEGTWIDEDYVDDDKYYLDGLEVAYTSSRPQIQYDINVIRLDYLEDFSSKVFHVGDVCYIKDQEFFNYITTDGLPYRLKIIISEITSYFDSPEKDSIKVQNYKTQFDDLFERIAAATQTLQFAQGSYAKAASLVNPDRTINFGLLQETFDYNKSIVLSASNQNVVWDATGITITDSTNSAQMLRLMSGGLFITNDGGATWKNAVRGDGISADVLTAGRINVGEIYVYNEEFPTFRWDSQGLTAYSFGNGSVNFNKFVRHDQYGFYGYDGNSDFVPSNENAIWTNEYTKFGLTWKGFFMKANDGTGSVVINSNDEHVISVTDGTSETFYLAKDGSAMFKGNITGGTISIGETNGEPNFFVANNGDVTMAGSIDLAGSITWHDNNPAKNLTEAEVRELLSKVDGLYNRNGHLYIAATYISAGEINANNVTLGNSDGTLKVGTGYDGVDTTNGPMLLSANENNYVIATDSGVRMTANGDNTNGTNIYAVSTHCKILADSNNYIIVHQNVPDGKTTAGYIQLYANNVLLSSGADVTSDRNAKNSIAYDYSHYENLFFALRPAYYKLNDGTSGRFHTGFIAQDVESALEKSGLTTQDFAGFIQHTIMDKDEINEVTGYGLRYSEFISLNTYMIQKAYKRIEALEAEIQALKSNKNEE